MPVLKNTPRYLDKDKEYRLLDESSMTDALNVRGVYNEGNDYLLLKNIMGNVLKSYTFPSGTNTCIGAIQEADKANIYYFVHNSAGNHSIVRYSSTTGSVTKVLQSQKLSFNLDYFIQGYAISAMNAVDTLLYFTDDINPPRKLNVTKAIEQSRGNYGDGYDVLFNTYFDYYTDQVKHPPLEGPRFEFGRDPEIKYNNISDKSFQFRYRYIYDDGEASAFSPYSTLAVPLDQISSTIYDADTLSVSSNYIDIIIKNGRYSVDKIEVAFRTGNDGGLRLIDVIENNPSQQETVIRFYNNGSYEGIAERDSSKLFDAVPLKAKTQTIKNNRNFWGNVVDSYALLPDSDKSGGSSINPRYYDKTDLSQNTIPVITSGQGTGSYLFNFSGMSFTPGTLIKTEVTYDCSWQRIGGIERKSARYRASYVVQPGDTLADITAALAAQYNSQTPSSNRVLFTVSATSNAVSMTVIVKFVGRLYLYSGTFSSTLGYVAEYFDEPISSMSFKSGANHEFGVVYYDRANRSSTVEKVGSTYVKFFSERINDELRNEELLGKTHIDWTIGWTPPSWATHYQWVYTRNTTIDDFLQYSCLAVYEPLNPDNKLYLSMRSLLGNYDSYTEAYGAKVDYSFVDGDRLRILNYKNPATLDVVDPTGYFDFRILGFEYLPQDIDQNPIYIEGGSVTPEEQQQRSGWFLIIEKPDVDGFSTADSTSLWFNNDHGAMFEIYRRLSETRNNVYFEFGEQYEIIDSGLPTRRHQGSLRDQGESASYDVSSIGITDLNYAKLDQGYDVIKIVAGDVVSFTGTNSPSGSFTVVYTYYDEVTDEWYVYFEEDVIVPGLPGPDVQLVLQSSRAAGIFENGDVWYRPRLIKYHNDISIAYFYRAMVEDYSFNDYYSSKYGNFGRVNAYTPYNVITRKPTTIYYSDTMQMGSSYNGLSSVYLAEAPYTDLDRLNNSIQKIYPQNESLIVYQENKVLSLPISRSVLETADGGQILTISTNIIGEPRYYVGDYGIAKNPESFAEFNGKHYFVDIVRGAALRLSSDGLTPISDYGVNSFFAEKAREYSSITSRAKVFGGFDVEHEEYVISMPQESTYYLVSNNNQSTTTVTGVTPQEPSGYLIGGTTVVSTESYDRYALNTEPRPMNSIDDNLSLSGYPIIMSETLSESNTIYVPESIISSDSEPSLLVVTTDEGDEYVPATLEPRSGTVSVTDPTSSATPSASVSGFTLSFSEPANKWVSFYSYSPEFMSYIGVEFVSFKNGQLYVHNRNQNRCEFYGEQYGSIAEFIVNKEPSSVKIFEATSLESTHPWSSSMNTNLNGTYISSGLFEEKEGFFYSYIPTTTSGTTDSHVYGIGYVESISSNVIKVSGLNTNNSDITAGDIIYNGSDIVGVVSGLSGYDSIVMVSISNLSIGDYVHGVKNQAIDGDFVRGYYLKNKLSITTTDEVELYASNCYVKKSYVHHS